MSYNDVGTNSNNDIVADGVDNGTPNVGAAGYAYTNSSGTVIACVAPSVSTTIHNDGNHTTGVTSVTAGSSVHDLATASGTFPSGSTVDFKFFNTSTQCTGSSTTENVALGTSNGGGAVTSSQAESSLTGALIAGNYSYQAVLKKPDGTTLATSACEPLTVTTPTPTPETPTVDTQVHDAAHNPGTSFPLGTDVHDKATVNPTPNNGQPTGTVDFMFFKKTGINLDCDSTDLVDTESGVAVGSAGVGMAESTPKVCLVAGSYAYMVHYNSNDATKWTDADSLCEPFTITPIDPNVDTDIHLVDVPGPQTHTVVTSVTMGASVHDKATVSDPSGCNITPTGTVDFTFYTDKSCTNVAAIPPANAVAGNPENNVALVSGMAESSDTGALSFGGYSYKVHYDGDTNFNAIDSICEELDVVSSISGFSYSVVSGTTVLQAGPFDCTLDTSTDTTLVDTVLDLCATGKTAAVVNVSNKGSVTSDYLVTVTVTNNTGGTVMEKVQGGLAAKATYLNAAGGALASCGTGFSSFQSTCLTIADISGVDSTGAAISSCGAATLNLSTAKQTSTSDRGNVVVWNSTGSLGSSTNPVAGFSMNQGDVCTLQVIVRKGYSSNQLQAVTSSWSEFQDGPGTFSGKSPYTGSLATCVLGNGFTGDSDFNCNP